MQSQFPVSLFLVVIVTVLHVDGEKNLLPRNAPTSQPPHIRNFFGSVVDKHLHIRICSILPALNEPNASTKVKDLQIFVNWIKEKYGSSVVTYTQASMQTEKLTPVATKESDGSDHLIANIIVHWGAQPEDIRQVRHHISTSLNGKAARHTLEFFAYAVIKIHTRPNAPCSLQLEVMPSIYLQPTPQFFCFEICGTLSAL